MSGLLFPKPEKGKRKRSRNRGEEPGLLFPKPGRKKRTKKHMKSILQVKDGSCYLCRRLMGDASKKPVQEHHVFGGPRRSISEAEGLKVYLCQEHHIYGRYAAHSNESISRILKQDAQEAWERQHSREEWMELMGKNYLYD